MSDAAASVLLCLWAVAVLALSSAGRVLVAAHYGCRSREMWWHSHRDTPEDYVERVMDARERGEIGITPARMLLGSASWRERWAYLAPHLLGFLHHEAATERVTGVHPWAATSDMTSLAAALRRLASAGVQAQAAGRSQEANHQ